MEKPTQKLLIQLPTLADNEEYYNITEFEIRGSLDTTKQCIICKKEIKIISESYIMPKANRKGIHSITSDGVIVRIRKINGNTGQQWVFICHECHTKYQF